MRASKVAVLGGGVGGMSAAHELAERGFSVEIFEARAAVGGKAQSQYVKGSGTEGRQDLPGEHGFRFFPAFYRHVIDTMSRIPYGSGSVKDNLRASTEAGLGLGDGQPIARFLRRVPQNPLELIEGIELSFKRLGIAPSDVIRFTERILRYYTSCEQRRRDQYEGMSWWDFLGGPGYSKNFQRYLAAIPRTMVAMDARRGSARTIGDISMQLMMDYGAEGEKTDRLLCGPTSEKWLEPWREYLTKLGVRFHLDCAVQAIHTQSGVVSGVELADGRTVQADHYVLAVPLEAVRPLITQELAALDPVLARLRHLPRARFDALTSWMNGIQFYLRRDVPLVKGHMFYPDAPWALTSISQPQFWQEDGLLEERYGDGSVRGLISVDVSDWETPGTFVRKPARDCTREEVAAEIWQQLRAAINSPGRELLREDDLICWHLDDELHERAEAPGLENHARLLVHPPGSWQYRPEAVSAVPNLVLAADYVRTHTDLASMEGANEAARRAVNGILARVGSTAPRCQVHALREPAVFAAARRLDAQLFASDWAGGRHFFDLLPAARSGMTALKSALTTLLSGRLPFLADSGSQKKAA